LTGTVIGWMLPRAAVARAIKTCGPGLAVQRMCQRTHASRMFETVEAREPYGAS
jgi:hypothetical protein